MDCTLTTIKTDVKKAIDEIAVNDASYASGQDNQEMDNIIESKVEAAADYVHEHAHIQKFDMGDVEHYHYTEQDAGGWMVDEINKVAYLLLNMTSGTASGDLSNKVEMLRMLQANVSSWPYPIAQPISWIDEEYAQVVDQYVGATAERPAVTKELLTDDTDIYDTLALRKLANTELDTADVWLVGRSKLSNSKIDVNKNLYRAFIYRIAGLTELVYSEEGRAKNLFDLSNMEMGLGPVSEG